MNLLDSAEVNKNAMKSGLVLFLLALILFSCEEPSELGENFVGDKDDIGVFYKEFSIEAFQKQTDSLISTFNERLITGYYSDPVFGDIYGEGYLDIDGLNTMPNVQESSVLDSVLLTFKVNYLYGSNLSQALTLSVFQLDNRLAEFRRDTTLADSILTTIDLIPVVTERQDYNDVPFGQLTLNPIDDIINKDSIITFKLTGEIFESIFQSIIKKDSSFILNDSIFSRTVRGLALVPDMSSSAILGFNMDSEDNNLRLHYHATGDTSTITFPLRNPRFVSHIRSDRMGTPLAGISQNDTLTPATDKLYIQNGVGIVPVIRFNNFQSFSDSVGSLIINSAILELKVDDWSGSLAPNDGFFVHVTDSTFNELITFDQNSRSFNPISINVAAGSAGSISSRRGAGFVPIRLNSGFQDIVYIDLTLFLQQLANKSLTGEYLMLYPNSYLMFSRDNVTSNVYRGIVTNLNRTILDKSQSKLRIHYTTVNN
jgi:hypothetical protein